MSDINIGVGLKGLPTPEMLNPSDKQAEAGVQPKLVGVISGENVSVMGGSWLGDLEKLLSTLKMEDEDSRAQSLQAIFSAQIQAIVGKNAALEAQALIIDSKIKAIEDLIESMKPTKEELETARRRKQTIADSIKTKEDRQKDLKGDLATKQALISTLDATKDAAQIAQLTQECKDLMSEISSLGDEVKQDKAELVDVEKKITDLGKKLSSNEEDKKKLNDEIEAGIKGLANAAKKVTSGDPLTKAEAENGVVEDVDPVEELEKREEELEKLGILTDIFQVWQQSLEGVQETDLKYGPTLQALLDEIDTNKNNLV